MANELDIDPISFQGPGPSLTQKRIMVSDTTIAEQFCMVASDMRSILAAIKTSVDTQRQLVESFDAHTQQLEKTMAGIDSAVNKIDDLIDQTGKRVEQLNRNTEILTAALTNLK